MTWTDESGNPVCACSHLWSNHHQRHNWYGCEAPECECNGFSEHGPLDEWADEIWLMENGEETKALDYDCERHGKGKGSDCPTCSMSDEKVRGRYMGGHDE